MGTMGTQRQGQSNVGGLYSIMQTMESKLGGGEGVEGIYGSVTATGMQKIFDCMHHNCALGPKSTLIDIGAGLGRPLLHAALSHKLAAAYGVELDPVKCSKADAFIAHVLRELRGRGLSHDGIATPLITRAAVERVASLDPGTHAYSFWEGVPREGKAAFGRLFRTSRTLKAVAVVQRAMRGVDPCLEMQQLGFGPLLLIKTFSVNMSGSGRSFTAYVFSKVPAPTADLLRRQARLSGGRAELSPGASPSPSASASSGGGGSRAGSPPPSAPRLDAGSADGRGAGGTAAARLVQLRTWEREHEAESRREAERARHQAGAGGSPLSKRGLAGGEGGAAGREQAFGSPSKKTRSAKGDGDRGGGGGQDDGARAADQGEGADGGNSALARSHSYGLRPKRLDLSGSLSGAESGALPRSASEGAAQARARRGAAAYGRSHSSGAVGAQPDAPAPRARAARRQAAGGDGSRAATPAPEEAAPAAGTAAAAGAPAEPVAVAGAGGGALRQAAISSMFRQRKAGVPGPKAKPARGLGAGPLAQGPAAAALGQ